jgi:hypothetical protein
MQCLHSFRRRDLAFESHTRHGCLVCVCVYSVFRQRSCDELITRPRSPTVCKMIIKLKNQRPGPKGALEQWKNLRPESILSNEKTRAIWISEIYFQPSNSISSFVFVVWYLKGKIWNLQKDSFACCFVWTWNLLSLFKDIRGQRPKKEEVTGS